MKSPVINLTIQGVTLRAEVDTGSDATLIREDVAKQQKWIINHKRGSLGLKGVTGKPLAVRGMVKVEVAVGKEQVIISYI